MTTFTHINEPYGSITFRVDSTSLHDNGLTLLSGEVIKGSSTNRIMHHTSTKNHKGEAYSLLVTDSDLKQGYKRSIAM